MGLITKEITYDYQLKQSISEMTVTCRLNKCQQRNHSLIRYHRTEKKGLKTQMKEACNVSYIKNESYLQ